MLVDARCGARAGPARRVYVMRLPVVGRAPVLPPPLRLGEQPCFIGERRQYVLI